MDAGKFKPLEQLLQNNLKHNIRFENNQEFICKFAKTPKEIRTLIEAGFGCVLERNGLAYFRKRKWVVRCCAVKSGWNLK